MLNENQEKIIKEELKRYMNSIRLPENLEGIVMEDINKVKNENNVNGENNESKKSRGSKTKKIIGTAASVLVVAGVVGAVGIKSGWFKSVDKTTVDKGNNITVNQMAKWKEENGVDYTDEDIVHIVMGMEDFDNGMELSTKKYLTVVYNALNEGYVTIGNKDKTAGKVEYTEDEIKSIVYALFGVELKENESIGTSFVYQNGKYILERSNRGTSIPVAKNISTEEVAGTKYIIYDYYINESDLGTEAYKGRYTIKISTNERFIKSKKKENTEEEGNGASKIEVSNENIVYIVMGMEDFDNGMELSTETYLTAVYNALNEGYVTIGNKDKTAGKVEYTEDEIKSLVYTLFGVNLKENASIGTSFVHQNGKYILEHSNRGTSIPVVKNINTEVASGTKYLTYDYYINESDLGTEVYKGKYAIGISSSDGFVKSKQKMETGENGSIESEKSTIIEFLNGVEHNGFIAYGNTYSNIDDCDLYSVFFPGVGNGIDSNGEEWQACLKYWNMRELPAGDIFKVTTSEAQRIYLENTGKNISKEDLIKRINTYLGEYDAFYHSRSDTNYCPVKNIKGYVNSNGEYVLDIYAGFGDEEEYSSTVTLKKNGNSYIFISNIKK